MCKFNKLFLITAWSVEIYTLICLIYPLLGIETSQKHLKRIIIGHLYCINGFSDLNLHSVFTYSNYYYEAAPRIIHDFNFVVSLR